ncbi:hypothetical protein KSP40_PGU010156 [Platanthera guangdongensis]|uniref:Uncharacterized protein n=1 Tax=Platanthera guangdongensis TaxID=2320717 RepID=A0ABR2MJU9_9ASPA
MRLLCLNMHLRLPQKFHKCFTCFVVLKEAYYECSASAFETQSFVGGEKEECQVDDHVRCNTEKSSKVPKTIFRCRSPSLHHTAHISVLISTGMFRAFAGNARKFVRGVAGNKIPNTNNENCLFTTHRLDSPLAAFTDQNLFQDSCGATTKSISFGHPHGDGSLSRKLMKTSSIRRKCYCQVKTRSHCYLLLQLSTQTVLFPFSDASVAPSIRRQTF